MLRIALLLCAALVLAACGSSKSHRTACPNQARALAKIQRDIKALAAAYKLPVKNKLIGNHAINVATDKFLNDVALAPITNLQRNRLIDHAMSAIGTHCQQCFQALEAGRPIPAIRAGELKCSS